jgi:hypothetical protein
LGERSFDQLNRFVIVVAALAVIFAALLAVLLAWGAPDEAIRRVTDSSDYLRRHNDRETKAIISLIAAVVVLLMLTVVLVELTPSPVQKMRVRSMKSGEAAITTSEIATRINTEVGAVPHVADCVGRVWARGTKVEVVLDLYVGAGANLAETADEACRRAHLLVEQQLGIEMAAMPRARLHYRELRLGDGGAAPAAPTQESSGWERPRT